MLTLDPACLSQKAKITVDGINKSIGFEFIRKIHRFLFWTKFLFQFLVTLFEISIIYNFSCDNLSHKLSYSMRLLKCLIPFLFHVDDKCNVLSSHSCSFWMPKNLTGNLWPDLIYISKMPESYGIENLFKVVNLRFWIAVNGE